MENHNVIIIKSDKVGITRILSMMMNSIIPIYVKPETITEENIDNRIFTYGYIGKWYGYNIITEPAESET